MQKPRASATVIAHTSAMPRPARVTARAAALSLVPPHSGQALKVMNRLISSRTACDSVSR